MQKNQLSIVFILTRHCTLSKFLFCLYFRDFLCSAIIVYVTLPNTTIDRLRMRIPEGAPVPFWMGVRRKIPGLNRMNRPSLGSIAVVATVVITAGAVYAVCVYPKVDHDIPLSPIATNILYPTGCC